MAVYNGADSVGEAVGSILRQTLSDLELIVVDDGSTDGTADVLASVDDARVKVCTNPSNVGLSASLNRGIGEARGEYLGRLDHDDSALPELLEEEIGFLRTHPGHVAVSCWHIAQEEGQCDRIRRPPVDDLSIRWQMLFGTPMPHPGLMVRASALRAVRGYDESLPCTVDYDLEARLAGVGKLHNLPEALIAYRIRPGQMSDVRREEQRTIRNDISRREIGRILGKRPIPAREREYAEGFFRGKLPSGNKRDVAMRLGLRIAAAFRRKHNCPEFVSGILADVLAKHVTLSKQAMHRQTWKDVAVRWWAVARLLTSGLMLNPGGEVRKALKGNPCPENES